MSRLAGREEEGGCEGGDAQCAEEAGGEGGAGAEVGVRLGGGGGGGEEEEGGEGYAAEGVGDALCEWWR